jgi:hypothetical protein
VIPISLADTGKLICRKALTKRNGDLILCWLIFVRTRKSSMAERTDHLLGLRIEVNIMVCHLKRESCRRIITPASIREVAMRRSPPSISCLRLSAPYRILCGVLTIKGLVSTLTKYVPGKMRVPRDIDPSRRYPFPGLFTGVGVEMVGGG